MKLVSIIIPAYNAAAFVKEAVDSALAQTYPDCEVIVVDDGSKDNTAEVLKPYIEGKKIIYIRQENKGLAGARNTGIRRAKGGYVALLDSDDVFMPEKISKQVAALEAHPDYGVCYCDVTHFADGDPRQYFHHRYRYFSGDLLPELLHKQFVNPLTVVARKEVFEDHGYFDESLRRSEDWDLWLRWAHGGVKFWYLDEQLAYYRVQHGGNLSSIDSEPMMKEKNLYIFERLGKSFTPEERRKYDYGNILRHLRLKLAVAYLMAGKKREALAHAADMPPALRIAVKLVPARVWKFGLALWRGAKHRLLLKKM